MLPRAQHLLRNESLAGAPRLPPCERALEQLKHGRPIVFTKEREEDATHVFRFGPLPETAPRTFAPVEELERMASLTLTDESLDLATGADLNRSADRLALRTYRHVYEYRFAAFPEGLGQ